MAEGKNTAMPDASDATASPCADNDNAAGGEAATVIKAPMPDTPQPTYVDDFDEDDPFLTGQQLYRMEFKPLRWIVPGLIPVGLTILASKSKLGKSWMVNQLGVAVGSGGEFLDRKCGQGEALVLALEDSPRRLHDRLHKQAGIRLNGDDQDLAGVMFKTRWPRIDLKGIQKLEKWIDAHPLARLIVIDVWRKIAPPHKAGVMAYNQDYDHLGGIQRLAHDRDIAIILVMHLKKAPGESGDPFDEVLGSTGQVGVADTALILRKTPDGVTLYARGRDVEEVELAVRFDKETCRWQSLGDATDLRKAKESNAIVLALREAGREMKTAEIVEKTRLPRKTVDVDLGRLVNKEKIQRVARGVYKVIDDDQPVTPQP